MVVQDIESILLQGGNLRFKQSIIFLAAAAAEAFTCEVVVVVYLFVQILLFLLGFLACNCLIPYSFFIRLNHSRKGAVAAAKIGHSAHVCHVYTYYSTLASFFLSQVPFPCWWRWGECYVLGRATIFARYCVNPLATSSRFTQLLTERYALHT